MLYYLRIYIFPGIDVETDLDAWIDRVCLDRYMQLKVIDPYSSVSLNMIGFLFIKLFII